MLIQPLLRDLQDTEMISLLSNPFCSIMILLLFLLSCHLLLCVSKNQEDATNIQNMLQELIAFDDSQVGEWIFSDGKRGASNSLYEGKWNKRAYKSLSSYIQLLEQVIACYKNNFAYFRMQGKHTIKQSSVLVPYEKGFS